MQQSRYPPGETFEGALQLADRSRLFVWRFTSQIPHHDVLDHLIPRVGALNQLNCGTTTLGDWCHNNPTPAHTDRAIDGLLASGIRSVFFHGSPKPDPKPGQKHFSEIPHPRSEVERLLRDRLTSRNSLVTLGMAILGPHYSTYEVAVHDFEPARELELVASMHCAWLEAKTPDGWARLAEAGLLGPNNNIVHGNNLSDAQLRMMLDFGVTFSLAPETEMTQGHGHPITGRLRDAGYAPSLIYCNDKPDALALREAHIVRHRAYLETNPIKVVMSGPLMDDAGERMNGSFFLVEAESRAEVESFNHQDPFFDLGLWSEVHIRRFYKRVG